MKIQRKHVRTAVRITAQFTASAVVQGALRSNIYPTTAFQKVVAELGLYSVGVTVASIAGERVVSEFDDLCNQLDLN